MNDVREQYVQMLPLFERFREKLHLRVGELLQLKGLRFDKLESRCKVIESFVQKCSNPSKHYQSPLAEVTDMVGIRVIFYHASDVDRFRDVIANDFEVDWANSMDKREILKPNEFGYQSVHLVCIGGARNLDGWAAFNNLKFEIQIRTVLQHAWASISHALHYKREAEVPKNLERRLYRLAGLLELADDEFTQIQIEKTRLTERLAGLIKQRPQEVPLDQASLVAYLLNAPVIGEITRTAVRAGFVETKAPPEAYAPRILGVAAFLKIGDIASLNEVLVAFSRRALRVFSSMRQAERGSSSWGASPPCFALFGLYASVPCLSQDLLQQLGWGTSQSMVDALSVGGKS